MATPSGQISLNDVNVELGKSGSTVIALGNTDVRGLAGVASGAISMNNLRGKSGSATISYTFTSSTANASLNLSAIPGYSAGKSNITVTINPGVYLYGTVGSGYGLNITGGTTGDTLTIVNNGYIMGLGGDGGRGANNSGAANGGFQGWTALNLGFGMSSCTINNTNGSAYIGGGGGGGGGGQHTGGGGGAGGGTGGRGGDANQAQGGTGAGIGSSGADGGYVFSGGGTGGGGGGGGRIFPGSGGAGGFGSGGTDQRGRGGGAGGGGAGFDTSKSTGNVGGPGGSSNNAGTSRTAASGVIPGGRAGGGGGWGASGGYGLGGNTGGGAGGKAINTNGKSITWTSGDTSRIWGSVS